MMYDDIIVSLLHEVKKFIFYVSNSFDDDRKADVETSSRLDVCSARGSDSHDYRLQKIDISQSPKVHKIYSQYHRSMSRS